MATTQRMIRLVKQGVRTLQLVGVPAAFVKAMDQAFIPPRRGGQPPRPSRAPTFEVIKSEIQAVLASDPDTKAVTTIRNDTGDDPIAFEEVEIIRDDAP